VVRGSTPIRPLVLGGGQERDRRSGTLNVAGIVGFAAALRAADAERDAMVARVSALRDRLLDGLVAAVPGLVETVTLAGGPHGRDDVLPGSCHVCIDGVDSEALLFLLETEGVLASAGSSCASGARETSHVLAAMGVPDALAVGALRLSLGRDTTAAEVDLALTVVPAAVARVRAFG
jgi:cysteine desulfurase